MTRWVTALVLSGLVLAASVSADVVDLPSVSCPGGALAVPSHYPREGLCLPQPCTSDVDCSGGSTCIEAPLCIVPMPVFQRDAGSYPDGGRPEPAYYDTAPASCGGGAACAMGTCETRRVCAPPARTGGGCSAGARPHALGVSWLAVAVALAVMRARARVR